MNTIEAAVLKVRLGSLLRCAINDKQIKTFVDAAKNMNMTPIQALEYLEGLKLSDEEIKKMIRGL